MERTIKPETLKAELTGKVILDVRRRDDRAKEPMAVPGATWRDPAAVEEWSAELSGDQDIVIYCVRGGSVSNSVVDALQAKGLRARFVEGGLEAWKAAGGAVELRP